MTVLLAAHVLARQPPDLVGEASVGTDRVEGGQPVLAADLAVDLTEGRRQVHEAGALFGGDVVRRAPRATRRRGSAPGRSSKGRA